MSDAALFPAGDLRLLCGAADRPVADLHPHEGEARLPHELRRLQAAAPVRRRLVPPWFIADKTRSTDGKLR